MNTDFLKPLQARIGEFPIELPAALLMAGAVAFVTMVMPDWRFESLVAASGLPAIVGAAQPPLGQTARVVAALVGAGVSFAAVWLGLRALDRRELPTDFPAFRAADLHPDAPRRRPILAGAEFGTPADDPPPIEDQIRRRKAASEPLPSFLAPQAEVAGHAHPARTSVETVAPAPTARAKPVIEVEPDGPEPAPDAVREPVVRRGDAASEPARRASVIADDDALSADPISADPIAAEPASADPTSADPTSADDEADPFWIELPSKPATHAVARDAVLAPADEPHRVPAPADEPEESVGELMARLESGLAKRGSNPVPQAQGGAAQEELARALGDLNRTTGRTG